GEVEDRLAGLRVEPRDQPLAHRSRRLPEKRAPALPARRHRLPLLGHQSERSCASSSAEGSHSPAAAFAFTCATLIAPAITEQTVGCAASPPIATSRRLSPRSFPNASSASMRVHCSSETSSLPDSLVPSGSGSPRRYFPVRRPLASG